MPIKVAILGSTGSIGSSTIEIIKKYRKRDKQSSCDHIEGLMQNAP